MSNLKQFLQEAAGFTTNVNVPELTKPSNHFANYMQEKKNQEIQAQENRLKRVEQYGSDFAQIGDKVHERTTLDAVGDVSVGVTQGIWGTVTGGLGAFISPEALERMNSVSETLEGWKSEQTQVNLAAYKEETGKFNRLIEDAIMRGDISQYEGEMAILKNSLKNMNAAQIESVLSQGIGSAAVLIAAHATGNPVVISGAWGAMGASSLASPADTILQELYAKDVNGNFNLTHEDLMESSGKYTAYFEQTNDPIEARRRLFNYTRNDAIWDAKNIGATAVEILGERALFKGAGLLRSTPKPPMFTPKEGGVIKNTVKGTTKFIGAGAIEATAESIGEAGSTISANQAMRRFADLEDSTIDPNKYRSLKGVGTVVADSIVGGAGTAGAVRSAGLAAQATGAVLERGALKEQEKIDALPENQAKKSMEELNRVNAVPEVEPDDHTETFKNIDNDFKWNDYQENESSSIVREITKGSANYVEASQKIVNKILDETTTNEEIVELGSALSNINQEIQQIVGNMAGALDLLESTDPRMEHALNWINSINQVMNNTEANEAFTKAVEQAANIDAKIDENIPLSEQTQGVKNLKDKMALNPESITEAEISSAKKVMEDVVNADTFSSQDRALINILEESITASKKIYGGSKDGVIQQVMFNEAAGGKGQSVVGHASSVLKSINRGQFENVPEQMGVFKRWINSHKSKLDALQRSKENNNSPQTYTTTSQNDTRPVEAAKPVTYSKKFNNMVKAELAFMENVYSQLENIVPKVEPRKETSKPKTIEEVSKPKAKQKQIDKTASDKARTAAINRVKALKAKGQEVLRKELTRRQAQLKEAKKGSQKEQALSFIVQALQQEIIPERKIEPKAKPEPVKVVKPTSTSHLSSQRSTLAPVENAVKQLQDIRRQLDEVKEIEDEINNNPNYDPNLEDQAEDLFNNASAGLQKIGENLTAFAEGLPANSPMRLVIGSINEAINSDETPEIIGAEVAQGLRILRNIRNSTGDLFAEPNQEGQEGGASSIKLSGKSPYTAKDQRKADVATKFIGQGVPGSSTAIYAKDFGDLANTGNYIADDVVFVSTNGARKNRIPVNLTELGKAAEAGATIVTDAPVDRNRTFNVGEREVAAFLSDKGYVESVDPTGIGIWTAPKTTPPKSRITEEQAAQLSDAGLNTRIEAIQVKREKGEATPEDEATFSVLDAEMSKREDTANTPSLFDKKKIKTNDDALNHIYSSNGNLRSIGSLSEYRKYIRGILKQSGIPSLAFHYSESGVINKNLKLNKDEGALFFFNTIKNAQNWSDWAIQGKDPFGKIYVTYLEVNSSKVKVIDAATLSTDLLMEEVSKENKKGDNSALVIENMVDWGTAGTQYALISGDFVELGSEKDIEGFRNHIKNVEESTQEKLLQEPEPVKEKKVEKEPETPTPKEEAQELSKKLNELSHDEYKILAQEVSDVYEYSKTKLLNILNNRIGEKTLENAPLQQINKIADKLISDRTKKTEIKEETKTEEKVEPEVSKQKEKVEETIGKSSWFKNIKLREGVTKFWDMDKPVNTMVNFFRNKKGFQGLSTTLERMSKKVVQVSEGVTDVVNNRIDKIGFKYNQDNARQIKDFNTVTDGLLPYLDQETIDNVFAQDTATKAREFAKYALVENGKTEQEAEAIIKDIQHKLAETRPAFRMSALMVDGVIPNEILAASTIAITNYFSGFHSSHASNELDTRDLVKFQKSIGFDKSEYDPDLSIVKIQNSNDPKAEPTYANINTLVQRGFVTSRQARKAITTDVFRILGILPDAKNTEGSMYLPIENLIGTLLSNVMESHETNKMYMEVNTGVTDRKGKSLRTFIPIFMPPLKQNIVADYDTTGVVDTLIDSFMNEREGARYINEMPTVSNRAKDGTKLSKSQYVAQKHQASIPFVINKNMDTVLTKVLGSDGIVEAFGEQILTNMNNNDRAAKEGKNNQLVNSVLELEALNNSIDLAGSNKEEAQIYYNFEVTSVLRSMMKGAYNPQSSKVVRAAVSPNKVQLDASNVLDDFGSIPYSELSAAGKFLAIAYAQAFGLSVHNMNHEQNLQALNKIMTPELLRLSDSWFKHSQEGSKAPKELISKSKELLENDWSELALQTLVEIGSLRNSKDPSKFTTHAYIEADGITNGPFMAAMMLGIDLTDSNWLQFAENGGLYIGQDINSNDFRSNRLEETGSLPDNYLDTARGAKQADTNRRNNALSKAKSKNERIVNEFKNHDSAVSEFISTIFGMVRTRDGGVEISRNAGKNPVTVTFYGSSLQGIGDKFAKEAISTINELSTVLINNNTNGVVDMEKAALAFFKDSSNRSLPKDEQVRLLHNLFVVIPEVTSKLKVYGVSMKGDDYAFLKEERSNFNVAQFRNGNWVINTDNLTNLRFPKQVMDSLNGNMTEYLAAPLDTALHENAESTLAATEIVKNVTNEYSKLVSKYFNSLLEEAKKEPEYDVHDGFSKKQVDRIIRKLDETGITYEVAGKKFTLVNRAGSAEGAKFESDANGRGGSVVTSKTGDPTEVDLASRIKDIGELGVAGIPRFVISFGDGATINHFVNETAKQEITGYMQVFDGINLSANNYLELSQLANDSVMKAIQDRPLNGLVRMMEKALVIPEIAEKSDEFKAMVQELKGVASRVNRNLDALNTMEYSIDQMAAVGKNAVNKGEKISNNKEEREAQILELTSEILIEKSKTKFKDMENVEATDKKNIHRVLKNTLKSFPKETRKLVNAIYSAFNRTGASINLGDGLQNSNYDLDTNTVNIQRTNETINPRSLVHEMAHATITKTLQLVAQGKEVGKETRQAISNLRTMFEEAATSKERYNNITWDAAIKHALNAKQSFLESGFSTEEANAAMLDEFLITFMTTPQLVEASKEVKTKTFIKRMTDAAFNAVRAILGIKRATKDDSLYAGLIKSWAEISQAKISEPLNNSKIEMLDFGSSKVERDTVDAIKNLHSKLLPVEEIAAKGEILSSIDKSVSSLKTAGLLNTLEEQESFKAGALVIGLASSSDRKGVQGLYRMAVHAAKELEPSHFGDTSIPDTPAYYEAMNKYNAAMGVFTGGANAIVRNMMGLVYASPVMKEAINKIGMPKGMKGFDRDSSFERALGSLGYSAIHKLSNKLDGINGTVPSDVINTLIEGLAKKHKGGLANELLALPSITYDKANDLVVQGLEHLGKNLDRVGNAVEGESKLSKSLGISIRAVGGIFNSDTAVGVAEGVSSALNSSDSFVPLKEVVHDIIGRTDSNKRTYDLIKQVRSAVQRLRQMYVESTPTNIKKRFKKEVTERQWEELTDSMYKTDMAAIASVHGVSGALDLLNNRNKVKGRIRELEDSINKFEGDNTKRLEKAKQLAKYMITGKTGGNLLKNATEVAKLYGEKGKVDNVPKKLVKQLDEYISLLAFTGSNNTAFNTLSKMEREGMHFTLASLLGNRREEEAKSETSNMLGFKGNTPTPFTGDIRVIRDSQADKYIKRGYKRVADYIGSELDTDRTRKGYYVSSLNSTRPFAQGIIQNAIKTVNGVDAISGASVTGRSIDINVTDKDLQRMKDRLRDDKSEFGLIPSYDEKGELIGVERPIDSAILNHVKLESSLPELIGIQRGRQIEEAVASSFNQVVIEQLELEYKESDKKDEFINILDPKSYENNQVIKDAVSILSKEALNYAKNLNGRFMVKKELLNNVIGYRQLGVASLFDGVTNINEENRHLVVGALEALVGDKAYYYLVKGDEILRGLVHDVKKVIVVKSVIVPAINGLSNIVHLMGRGVPIKDIITKIPKMIAELEQYTNAQKRLIEIETEILAAEGVSSKILKLETERDIIQARITKLNIYPLIEAGEFASIVSAKIDQESTTLQKGKIAEYLEGKINKLDLSVRTFAKNAAMSEDTSIYQFLQKSVDYGDFVAKAIMFEDLVNRQNRSKEYAIGKIREEFINYDFLPGRFRGMLEGMGLLWFFNFKMRSLKIALSMIRENPLHTITTMGVVPMGTPWGDLGIPIDDNVVYQIGEGTVDRSVGIGMGLRGYQLHPVSQLLF